MTFSHRTFRALHFLARDSSGRKFSQSEAPSGARDLQDEPREDGETGGSPGGEGCNRGGGALRCPRRDGRGVEEDPGAVAENSARLIKVHNGVSGITSRAKKEVLMRVHRKYIVDRFQ